MRDEEEVRQAMERYGPSVWRVCMVHLKNRTDAEDILQNVFLKYALRDDPFESQEHEKAWVLRVAINQCRDLLSSVFRSRTVPLDQLLEEQADPVPQEHREVLQAVLSLPVKFRDVVYLYYFEGYKAAEIGKLLGKKVNTVYTLLERARKLLKVQLEGGDGNG